MKERPSDTWDRTHCGSPMTFVKDVIAVAGDGTKIVSEVWHCLRCGKKRAAVKSITPARPAVGPTTD